MENEAKAAAKWWRDTLERGFNQDNGDLMSSALGNLTRSKCKPEITTSQYDQFEENLRQAILREFKKWWYPDEPERGSYHRILMVDYHPVPILSDAACLAGINGGISFWPWKTYVHVDPGLVRVRMGYGADYQTIWQKA